jgi:hypothetical protein
VDGYQSRAEQCERQTRMGARKLSYRDLKNWVAHVLLDHQVFNMVLVVLLTIWSVNPELSLKTANDYFVIRLRFIVYIRDTNAIVVKLFVFSNRGAPPLMCLKKRHFCAKNDLL